MRVLTYLGRGMAALAVLGMTAWGTLALYYQIPLADEPKLAVAAPFAILGALAALRILWGAWRLGSVFAIAFTLVLGWWLTIVPSNDRDWEPYLAKQPAMAIVNGQLLVRNLRNVTWRAANDYTLRWEDRLYDLAKVEGVDLFFSYWTGPAIAHVIVSFPFADQPPLAFSIEIRREKGERYSPLAGFFKRYELMIVAADERDIVRLRTNVWQEDVRLYRLGVSREKARALLAAYAEEVNTLSVAPRWYDTLGANCTVLAFRLAQTLWPDLRFDWRVLLPGYGPDYAYEIGAVDTRLPLAELKEKARVTGKGQAAGDRADFSARLREGVPRPPL